jgi:DNA-binding winged helix-turn-helix (wHTH) protein
MNIAVSKTQFAPSVELFRQDLACSRHYPEAVRNVMGVQLGHSMALESADNNDVPTAILFGPFRLLPAKRLLLEGDEPVRIGSRALEILIALVEHHGELLSKNTLMERVWPDTTVVEANLSVHVAALRRALRDGSDGNRYLVNMPGRGYRFVAPITLVEDQERSRRMDSSPKPLQDLPKLLKPLLERRDNLTELAEQSPEWCQLIVAAATLAAEMLKGAPGVQALATSREPRRAEAAHGHHVSQLANATVSAGLTAEEALGFDAAQLFVERVEVPLGEFELKDAADPIMADA